MNAITYNSFGALDVLRQENLPLPTAPADGVLVRVLAASVNVIDSRTRRGEMGILVNKKFPKIPGVDFSGVVSGVGSNAKHFKIGDAVFGSKDPMKGGAMAETVAVGEDGIALKPESISFEEAAALPVAGLAALSAMRDLGQGGPGKRALLYGSSGGTGLMAIQIAKYLGMHVTAVCGTPGVSVCKDMGADATLDYKKGPIKLDGKFDVIVDFSGHFPFATARQYLSTTGRFVEPSPKIPQFIMAMILNPFRRQKEMMLQTTPKRRDLEFLATLADQGKLKVAVAEVFSMASVQKAFALQEAGGVIGKVVVRVAETGRAAASPEEGRAGR